MSRSAATGGAGSSVGMRTAPHPDRHTRRREQTRRRLLDSARALFARQGVESTRINEITDEADVGFGSFYNHFDSKEAIVEAVVEEAVAAQGDAVATVTADLDDPAEVVAAAHRYFVNLARSDPEWGWLLIRLDASQKIGLRALGPFARRDLERGIRARRFGVPTSAWRWSLRAARFLGSWATFWMDVHRRTPTATMPRECCACLACRPKDAAEVARRPMPKVPTPTS